jgi:hypothetical protein
MGLIASQLGNIVQSSVDASARSEVGGLQFTASNLGSALGTALIGSFVIGALASASVALVSSNPDIAEATRDRALVSLSSGVAYVPLDKAADLLSDAGIEPAEAESLIANYADAQLTGLRAGLLACAGIVLIGFALTRRLPTSLDEPAEELSPASP